jgi:hypothetical protein
MTRPRPAAIRLATLADGIQPARWPSPPFGLRAWTSDADAVAVLIDATEADVRDVAAVAAQLPEPQTVAPGAAVVVLGVAARTARGWRRLLGARHVAVPRAVRCAALLVRGYVDIGCAPDDKPGSDLAWGVAPENARTASNGTRSC